MSLLKVKINGLFGKFNMEVDLTEKCNIFTGANGVGKSTALRIITSISKLDFISLLKYNFMDLEITYSTSFSEAYQLKVSREHLAPDYKTVEEAVEHEKKVELAKKQLELGHSALADAYLYLMFSEDAPLHSQIIKSAFEDGWLPELLYMALQEEKDLQSILVKRGINDKKSIYLELIRKAAKELSKNDLEVGVNCFKKSRIEEEINSLLNTYKNNDERRGYSLFKKDFYTDSNIIYVDLVPGFFFDKDIPRSYFHYQSLAWIDSVRAISKELNDIDNIDDMPGWWQEGFDIGVPYSFFEDDVQEIRRIWKRIISRDKEICRTKNGDIAKLKNQMMDQFEKNRHISFNTLIAYHYYPLSFVQKINESYKEILLGFIEEGDDYYYSSRANNIVQESLSMPEEYRSDFEELRPVDILKFFPFIESDIRNFMDPIIADPSFRPDMIKDMIGGDALRFTAYGLLSGELMDSANRSELIDEYEEKLQKYLTTAEVTVLPSGLEFRSKLNDEDIDINSLSSGEKKIIFLLSIAAFMDGVSFLLDEPELSLSIVWQRDILKDMLELNALRNITVATQSPFLAMDESVQQYIRYLPQEEYHE